VCSSDPSTIKSGTGQKAPQALYRHEHWSILVLDQEHEGIIVDVGRWPGAAPIDEK
jgi:hypothetical protein